MMLVVNRLQVYLRGSWFVTLIFKKFSVRQYGLRGGQPPLQKFTALGKACIYSMI
jgi:hypothetical protein